MDIKKIPPAYTPEKLLQIAFNRAAKEARKVQVRNKGLRKKRAEERRVRESADYIVSYLTRMEKLGDKIETADPFHRELLETCIGLKRVHSAIDRLSWARIKIAKLEVRSRRNIRMRKGDPVTLRKDFYGKTASILGKTRGELNFLGDVKLAIKNLPTIKEGYTVVLAGMPNVGKSSLLRGLTPSTPEIQTYPFTTKNILLGYIPVGPREIQIIDTPGILDRPLADRNHIEKQAILALRELADLILFVFDPTETCGYPMNSQISLYREIESNFQNVNPVLNKSDITPGETSEKVEKEIGGPTLKCSATEDRIDEVKSFILQSSKNRL